MKPPEVLGVVGARSGGKAIPDKNIKPLAGKPLMAWIIEAAKKSKYVTRLILSTDSEKYAEIGRRYGAETPFLRPAQISGPLSSDIEYIRHAVDWLEANEGYHPGIVLRLMPTVPLQQPEDIDGVVLTLLNNPEAHSAAVVAEARQHPHKALKIIEEADEKWLVSYLTGKGQDVNPVARQKHERAYFRANVIATKTDILKTMNSLSGEKIKYHIVPQWHGVDIDSPLDFFIAEKLMEYLKSDPHSKQLLDDTYR